MTKKKTDNSLVEEKEIITRTSYKLSITEKTFLELIKGKFPEVPLDIEVYDYSLDWVNFPINISWTTEETSEG